MKRRSVLTVMGLGALGLAGDRLIPATKSANRRSQLPVPPLTMVRGLATLEGDYHRKYGHYAQIDVLMQHSPWFHENHPAISDAIRNPRAKSLDVALNVSADQRTFSFTAAERGTDDVYYIDQHTLIHRGTIVTNRDGAPVFRGAPIGLSNPGPLGWVGKVAAALIPAVYASEDFSCCCGKGSGGCSGSDTSCHNEDTCPCAGGEFGVCCAQGMPGCKWCCAVSSTSCNCLYALPACDGTPPDGTCDPLPG